MAEQKIEVKFDEKGLVAAIAQAAPSSVYFEGHLKRPWSPR